MLPYPFSYFNSIWGFRKPLSQRFGLNWFQLIFTSIFLISLSMVPIAIQNSSQESNRHHGQANQENTGKNQLKPV